MSPVTALFLFAIPVMDTLFVMLRRMLSGKSPFNPDRMHLHHLLQGLGLGVSGTICVILLLAVGIAGTGIYGLTNQTPENHMFLVFIALFSAFIVLCNLGWWRVSKLRHSLEDHPARHQ